MANVETTNITKVANVMKKHYINILREFEKTGHIEACKTNTLGFF